MKKINLKQPRYVIPLICLPFILLLFFVYKSSADKHHGSPELQDSLQAGISPVSSGISEKGIVDKLQAFKERYKKGDGYTAISTIELEQRAPEETSSAYNNREKYILDSISLAMKSSAPSSARYPGAGDSRKQQEGFGAYDKAPISSRDDLAEVLKGYASAKPKRIKPEDPMAMFRAQMAIVDSMNQASISRNSATVKQSSIPKSASAIDTVARLQVSQDLGFRGDSSTILVQKEERGFIQAMIDKSLTGFSGSRVAIRILSDLSVGDQRIKKGSLLYGLITGFAAQRVQLTISSILYQGNILPVKLEIYDLDGIKGIYVPASVFREFSRDLSTSSVSGLSIESATDKNQQLMSLVGRMFQSTTGAVNKLIRSQKAHIRYPTLIYLIDASVQSSKTKQ